MLVILGRQWRKGDPIGGESNPDGTLHAAVDEDIVEQMTTSELSNSPVHEDQPVQSVEPVHDSKDSLT